jgi:hypothetical protein
VQAWAEAAVRATLIPLGTNRLPLAQDVGGAAVLLVALWVAQSLRHTDEALLCLLSDGLHGLVANNPPVCEALAIGQGVGVGAGLRDTLLGHVKRAGCGTRARRSLNALFATLAAARYVALEVMCVP